MKIINIKYGILVCPNNFRRLGDFSSEKCTKAYVVTSKNGSIAPILYLCDMDMEEMESFGIDNFLDYVGSVYPEVAEVIEKEVEPIFSEDGKLLNATEYAMSDRIGVFEIKDVTDENELHCNCGIIRRNEA